MFVEERKQAILDHVKAKKKASVVELCEKFGVSSATIRNDLCDMERNRLLMRTHGGAIIQSQARFEPQAADKYVQNAGEKRAIARLALDMVEDGDTLILDTGSTTLELARLLKAKKNITVLTNDFAIATCLEDHPDAVVYLIGGVVRKGLHCSVGNMAKRMLQGLAVDKAFMAANSFSLEKGAGTPDLNQADLKRRMLAIATKVIFLIDSSKFGKNSFTVFATLDSIDCLVTDSITEEFKQILEDGDVEVVAANVPSIEKEEAQ